MKKLILSVLVCFSVLSCASKKKVVQESKNEEKTTIKTEEVVKEKKSEVKSDAKKERETKTTKRTVEIAYKPETDEKGNTKPFNYNDGKNKVDISGNGEVKISVEENSEQTKEREEINILKADNESIKTRLEQSEKSLSEYKSLVEKTNSKFKYVIGYAIIMTILFILLVVVIIRWWIRKKKSIFVAS